MRSFPYFLTLLLTLATGGTEGFGLNAPKFAVSPHPSVAIPSLSTSSTNARVAPLVQVMSSISVDLYQEPPTIMDSLKNVASKYMRLNEEKPLMTKGVSAALIGAVGDVFSQSLFAFASGARFQWDMTRTLTFTMMGLCFKGPFMHVWYNVLGRIAHWTKVRKGFSENGQSLTAITVDQTVGVAMFYPLYFVVFELLSSALAFRCKSKMDSCRAM